MIDKIPSGAPTGYTRDARPIKGNPEISVEQAQATTKSSTEVSLSEKAQFLQKALKAAQDAPEVRETVVADIKQQIEAGTYKVDHQKLAERLLAQFK